MIYKNNSLAAMLANSVYFQDYGFARWGLLSCQGCARPWIRLPRDHQHERKVHPLQHCLRALPVSRVVPSFVSE